MASRDHLHSESLLNNNMKVFDKVYDLIDLFTKERTDVLRKALRIEDQSALQAIEAESSSIYADALINLANDIIEEWNHE